MLELTTGAVFLISSLYGSGNPASTVQIADTQTPATAVMEATTTSPSSFIDDPKGMEAYLRGQYADEPILVDIARCESQFRQFDSSGNVIHGLVDKEDIGVMQINSRYQGLAAQRLGYDIYTVQGNVAYAKRLYEDEGTQPWSASEACWSHGEEVAAK
jgi:hypothetical protein